MWSSRCFGLLLAITTSFLPQLSSATPSPAGNHHIKRADTISPKVFIISMFTPEAEVWHGISDFDVLAQNITVAGFSPLFPDAHCTSDGQICQMVTGEAEINAAASVSALVLSPDFNLTQTYFLIAGIAGVNPEIATTASVIFAKYAVQVALQYEFDAREIPANFSTGYFPQGSDSPNEYPQDLYGTEVFEVSESLRQLAVNFASNATLNDTTEAQTYRARYANDSLYAAAATGPRIHACDVATSDAYFSGSLLGSAFANTTKLFTNNSGTYCATAQEDNATLESLLRGHIANKTDFTRIIIMRTASDFDRPPPGESPLTNLIYADQGGFEPAVQNIYLAGVKVVNGIVGQWEQTFEAGVPVTNYVGDVFGSIGGTPDFGLPELFLENRNGGVGMRRRGMGMGMGKRRREGSLKMKRAREAALRAHAYL